MRIPLVLVIDGQGGGLGKELIEQVRIYLPAEEFSYTLLACGTNSAATQNMLKSGADLGATGESAIIYNAQKADYILGPAGILSANSLLGELSPAMANSIGSSEAIKYIVPINKCRVRIADDNLPLPQRITDCVKMFVSDFKFMLQNS
ncbi:DUF3842 family protein [Mageeibacillus indolicus]|jgi:hypothetical protein|uniref:DUF3842 domain-containing protein n=2 Tax=Mageeibacillus indolicus TaxID=884684 RepID=D3R1G3_MAGIU|nr:DUF3842 family protein [Mageeibacillus indolicus]ADC90810.1 hypothetical protein HMPREF0868_0699 [Mageeibacillus indolicus UPII9-5]KFA57578.1 hypothetical protein HMPREF1632_02845 [Mageeibacillus indolicus 0009-5]PNH19518.1 hypothetical protein B7R76_01125 [Mageeibacillus indolicus]